MNPDPAATSAPTLGMAALGASVLTRCMRLAAEPRRALCNDCRGKGFDLEREPGKRAARKCPRCRGAGSFTVGSTKR